jgi:hypothetical protein
MKIKFTSFRFGRSERGSVSRSNGYNPRPLQTTSMANSIPLNIGGA